MNGGSIVDDFKNAFNKPNNAHVQLILINVIIWAAVRVFGVFLSGDSMATLMYEFGGLPSNLSNMIVKPWTWVTYMFLHWDFWHIFMNMLFLYWFGRIVAEFLGSEKVIKLYVLGGIAGGVLYIILYNLFFPARVAESALVGASAGVFGVVVGAATFMPNYTFFLLFLGPVRIKYIAIFFVFTSFINSKGFNAGGEIAHLGGAIIGYLYIKQLQRGTDIGNWVMGIIGFFKSFFTRQSKIKVSYSKGGSATRSKPKAKAANSSKVEQEEIDAILDKISQSGYESLSKEEKQKLFNASKK